MGPRLLLPRSGLERSDFVRVPKPEVIRAINHLFDAHEPTANKLPSVSQQTDTPNYAIPWFRKCDGRFSRISRSFGGRCNVAEGASPNKAR